ncbi:C40 family peptidase [Inhella gelatinilytica]|uniref:C40 family peptidase n=1 Tax=Inhella gelatinilytica TaxID=2795030 RepID=A0A931J2M7_9BURK|nr:C40 family peptidase [Inhella gelatinilytica]MBH9554206.1 C40 family peptidase [Inhella gelatinilytica]
MNVRRTFRHPAAALILGLCVAWGAQANPANGPPHPDAPSASASSPAPSGAQGAAQRGAIERFLADKGWMGPPGEADTPTLLGQVRDGATTMVRAAMGFLGVPYQRGGNTAAQGFDCSGFTRYVFEHSLGLVLPRRADEQARLTDLLPIAREELKPGDLVFFNTMRRTFSHVGIYVGENKFIHAPRAGAVVRVEDMRDSYWERRFTGARRAPIAN